MSVNVDFGKLTVFGKQLTIFDKVGESPLEVKSCSFSTNKEALATISRCHRASGVISGSKYRPGSRVSTLYFISKGRSMSIRE
jgi:hypothetical protein